ncbi:MAG: TPM domain-containing protein [Candidatus Rokubacteria bacterium]|nr:TPM domain-containing protein [Candidatus Rokubacteria bacterium]
MSPAPPRWLRRRLTAEDLDAIAHAVGEAEARTSAEIRVHLEPRVPHARPGRTLGPLDRAREVFRTLGMHDTRDRNGVLVYVALADRKLAVIGDEGIHARLGDAYWAQVRDLMVERFGSGASREALVGAVAMLGAALAEHFPRRPDDVDELPNRVSVE